MAGDMFGEFSLGGRTIAIAQGIDNSLVAFDTPFPE
jgi:hypothetical protein